MDIESQTSIEIFGAIFYYETKFSKRLFVAKMERHT